MDVDRFIAMHRPSWDRLAWLAAQRGRRVRGLGPEQVDELVLLYQRTSGHLAHARATFDDPDLDDMLTRVVADANAAIYGTRSAPGHAVVTFFRATFPGAVWRMRWFVFAAAINLFLPALVIGTWFTVSDAALEASGPEAVRTAYIEEDFEAYYSSAPAAEFATEVTVNNIRVAITAYALGVTACLGTFAILGFNGAVVGQAAGLFHAVGEAPRFWGLILPHGLLELSAVVIAGAAGLRLGWTLIDPGDRSRAQAFADEGRRSIPVVLGLVLAFVAAGLIEGFVTGSSLPTVARVGVGVAVEAAFVLYILSYGRRAEAEAAAESTNAFA